MKKAASFAIILAGALWGAVGIFVRILETYGLDSLQYSFVRNAMTVIVLTVVLFFWNRKLFRIRFRDLGYAVLAGSFGIFGSSYCYFRAAQLSSLSLAATLMYTSPIFVMVLSAILFKEKFTKRKLAALILTTIGCALVGGIFFETGFGFSAAALLIGIASGFVYALYSIFTRFLFRKDYPALTIMYYCFLSTVIPGLLLTDSAELFGILTDRPMSILILFLNSLVCTVAPWCLYTFGLKYVDNGKASILSSNEPAVATILGFLLFDEKPTLAAWLGVAMVIAAIFVLMQKNSQQPEEGPD